ncbi:MAG: HAD family hydrolase [Myxococcota bacterium]
MTIRAIVFDLFDTLVDLRWERLPVVEHDGKRIPGSSQVLYERVAREQDLPMDAFMEAMRANAQGFARSHYAQDKEVPTPLRFRALLRELEIEAAGLADELTELHMGVLQSAVENLPHHPAVLDRLAEHVSLAVCSNFSHSPTALSVLENAGLRDRFSPGSIIVSDAFGLRKPRAEIFEAALDPLGVAPEETLHVGDSLRADVGGASPLGIRTVWITRRISDHDKALREHEGPEPDFVIQDLDELPTLVRSLAGAS